MAQVIVCHCFTSRSIYLFDITKSRFRLTRGFMVRGVVCTKMMLFWWRYRKRHIFAENTCIFRPNAT